MIIPVVFYRIGSLEIGTDYLRLVVIYTAVQAVYETYAEPDKCHFHTKCLAAA